jgi:hypothetical protein
MDPKSPILEQIVLSTYDWQIVTDVSKGCNAFIFRVKLSLTNVLCNCVNGDIRNKKGCARHS